MWRTLRSLGLIALISLATARASAFALLGPFTAWMDTLKQYQIPSNIGGPMNTGEEYRWNLGVITYSYAQSFLTYFGEDGRKAVEQAVGHINALPPMSRVDLSAYPLNTTRNNYLASSLLLLDLKSYALWGLLEELGLDRAEEWVWCLRDFWKDNAGFPNFLVIQRNFDPVTWNPTAYVNGTLYTYRAIYIPPTPGPELADAIEYPVDPLAQTYTSVASGLISYGTFYTGLTRDDVGGLRFIYRSSNYHVENPPLGVTITNSSIGLGPWWPVDVVNTNATNAAALGGVGGVGGIGVGGGGVGGVAQTTNVVITTALRGGVDKIVLQRVDYDSLLGQFVATTNQYIDSFVTNGVVHQQAGTRVLTAPDILFDAQDLGLNTAGNPHFPIAYRRTDTSGWTKNNALNGTANLDGPGIIPGPVTITFSKVGPNFWNGPGFMTEASATAGPGGFFVWGSFDGTTNAPIVYPKGTSIRDLERRVLGR